MAFGGTHGPFLTAASFVAEHDGRPVAAALVTVWKDVPLLAYVFKDALPVCPRFRPALMDPQTIHLDHGGPLLRSLEKHAVRLLNSLQIHVRHEAQPLPQGFGDDNAPGFIDLELHTIYATIYHQKWQPIVCC